MKRQLIVLLLSTSFLMSCDKTNKLLEEDYKWMPYIGNETLVFKSDHGETDTLFILKKDTILAYPEAQALNGIVCEEVSVFCNHYGLNTQKEGRSYYFFKVQKTKNKRTELYFDLSTKDAVFYRIGSVNIDSLLKRKPITLQTASGQYDDVYTLLPDDNAKDFYNRSDFVTKLYWSISGGLIRYDKKDNIYWELSKKY